MAGPLKNNRHETFCLLILKGMAAGPAYLKAGYKAKGRHSSDPLGSKLTRNVKVSARIAELQASAARKAEVTVESLIADLEQAETFAKDEKNPSALVSAIMGKARITGNYVGERVNLKTPLSDMPGELVQSEIKRLLAENAERQAKRRG